MTVDKDIDTYVANRLRYFRTLRGMSQGALADTVGISFQQVQKYERGDNRVGAGRLFCFARALDISPMDLFPPASGQEYPPLSPEEQKLMRCYAGITLPELRDTLLLIATRFRRIHGIKE